MCYPHILAENTPIDDDGIEIAELELLICRETSSSVPFRPERMVSALDILSVKEDSRSTATCRQGSLVLLLFISLSFGPGRFQSLKTFEQVKVTLH